MKFQTRGSGLMGHALWLEARWTLVPPRVSKLLCDHREPFPRPLEHTHEQTGTHTAALGALGKEKS